MKSKGTIRLAAIVALLGILAASRIGAEPPKQDVPSDADLAKFTKDNSAEIPLE